MQCISTVCTTVIFVLCVFVQVLQSPQQAAIVKSSQVPQTTSMVTLRGQPHSRIVVGQPPVQVKQLNTGVYLVHL